MTNEWFHWRMLCAYGFIILVIFGFFRLLF